MLSYIWQSVLYQPVFNFLIWIYNDVTAQNFGWAVVVLTAALRVVLLPLTVVAEMNKQKNTDLEIEVERIIKEYRRDPVLQKQEIRSVMKKRKVYPWAKFVSLGIQALVFLLLYQVFVHGLSGERIVKVLYPFIDFPGKINTMFYGFDLTKTHDTLWAGLVGVWLAVEIYFGFRGKNARGGDMAYFVAFPLFVFFFLWWLPMVKSLFILSSMLFSFIVHQIIKLAFPEKKATK